MKKTIYLFIILLFTFVNSFIFAKKADIVQENDLYEYNNIVSMLEKVTAPTITDRYIIFTQKPESRFIGIVFDFENYKTIHRFQIHATKNLEGDTKDSLMFFILDRPKEITTIKYRLIIDGLWTSDPENPNKIYDETSGISLSYLNFEKTLPEITNIKKEDIVKFIYNGEPGKKIRLAGTFTNWDSWIYELYETKPGLYELEIPLPSGKYYYNYYLGMKSLVDKTNPNRVYTEDGRTASVITVN